MTRRVTRRALTAALATACLALGLAAGCSPILVAQSAAPPGRAARLDEVSGFWGVKRYRMELSQGVALALTCYQGGPCEQLSAASDDPAIAEVRRASLGALERSGMFGQATAAALVIVGKAPGTTQIRVRSKDGHRDIAVTVIPPPAPAPPPGYGAGGAFATRPTTTVMLSSPPR